ncbi:isomerase [Roseibium polysiphoniae]|uniref:Isomerase n=1 Tax=Roseibium polysiphoniae TaxID=2571221 RepID=A0A944GSK7_9HYPH|nr:TIM barrel protein [Roseibium polysiphoniae]MBS8260409.1 isomerase [Roseibium polysiphoniae]
MKFSANLGFLWHDRPLPEAISLAAAAGFEAVECHFPYETDPAEVRAALSDTGLPMLALNTLPGDRNAGEFGLCALPGREADARRVVSQAVDYAALIGVRKVHVMAGLASGEPAHRTFLSSLAFASDLAAKAGLTVLIEPINTQDVPGYFLNTTDQALEILAELDRPNVKLMFDCYHVHIMEGDLASRLRVCLPMIGHVQIAAVPGRGEPDQGVIDYVAVMKQLRQLGYDGFIGAEYKPRATVEDGLGWMQALRV